LIAFHPAARDRALCALGTAGTGDFYDIEMRLLDRKLTSPHHLAVFSGGHTLPPDAVARGDRVDGVASHQIRAAHASARATTPKRGCWGTSSISKPA
jgi:hypothetical protein